MRIIVGDIHSNIETTDGRAVGIVRKVCRARPNGYMFMPKYKSGMWDGYISLMPTIRSFPTGLLGFVVKELREVGYNPVIEGLPDHEFSPISNNCLRGIKLRPYQVEAADKLLASGRGVAKMATNSGKTEVMAAIIKAIDQQTIVLVHRKELMYQTAKRFEKRLGKKIGRIGDGIYEPMDITVAMIQTLSNMLSQEEFCQWISTNKVLMVDECHNASSDQYMQSLTAIPGHWRYGFSGTPLKHDDLSDMRLIGSTGRVIMEVDNEQLIDKGYSAKPVIHVHVIEDLSADNDDMDYHEAYDTLIVQSEERNAVVKRIAEEVGGVVLVIVVRVDHGRKLADMIPGSQFIYGGDSTECRQDVLEQMRSGREGVYIATSIFDEGIDVPNVGTLILASGGKSHVRLLQRVGRGLRQKLGENVVHIHDFLDDTNDYLLDHSEKRMQVYEDEGFQFEIHDSSSGAPL